MNKQILEVWAFASDSNPQIQYETLQYADGSTSLQLQGLDSTCGRRWKPFAQAHLFSGYGHGRPTTTSRVAIAGAISVNRYLLGIVAFSHTADFCCPSGALEDFRIGLTQPPSSIYPLALT